MWRAIGLVLLLVSCESNRGKDIIFLIDTSGSVRRASLVPRIQESVRTIVSENASQGDRVRIFYFDKDTRPIVDQKIHGDGDKQDIYMALSRLEAYGKYTYLAGALETVLEETRQTQRAMPGRKVQIILYTDGRNDPPPTSGTPVTFDDLMNRYFKGRTQQEDWFIFYVQMNEPEPALERLITTTQTGRVIKPEEFKQGANFVLPEIPGWLFTRALPLGLLLFLILGFQRWHPWFRSLILVPSGAGGADAINLGALKKPLFKYHVEFGQLRFGVDLVGRYYVQPNKDERIWIDGTERSGRQFVTLGQRVRIDGKEYSLAPSQLRDV